MNASLSIILSKSRHYPELHGSFMQGLTMGLKQAGIHDPQLEIQYGNPQTSRDDYMALCNTALVRSSPDLCILFAEEIILNHVQPVFENNEMPVWVVNFGGFSPSFTPPSPWVHRHSWQEWLNVLLMTERITRSHAQPPAVLLDTYESGFHYMAAVAEALNQQAPACLNILRNNVTDETAELLRETLLAGKATALLAGMHSQQAAAFFAWWQQQAFAGKVPVYGGGWLVEPGHAAAPLCALPGTEVVTAWYAALDLPANHVYARETLDQRGKGPDPFHLLGYETGFLTGTALKQAGDGGFIAPNRLNETLRQRAWDSPRGPLYADPLSRTQSPRYHCTVEEHEGVRHLRTLHTLPVPADYELRLSKMPQKRSGWWNPYTVQ